MKLLLVVLYEKAQRAEIFVEDDKGKRRSVNFHWRTKDRAQIPDHWVSAVVKELANQDAEALAKSQGRQLIGRAFPAPRKPPPRKL